MKVNDKNYFSIQAWMVTRLKLRGAERDVYAIIYGYSQDEDSDFHGSLQYLSELTGYSRNSICTALNELTTKGLLEKEFNMVNNIKYCRYRTTKLDGVQLNWTGLDKNSEEGVQVTCTHNNKKENNIDNKENNKSSQKSSFFRNSSKQKSNKAEIQSIVNLYNEVCTNLSKVRALTDKRQKAISNILKNYDFNDIKEVFENANNNSFLTGDNDRGWKADLDFILREDKFVKILENGYGSNKGKGYKKRNKDKFAEPEYLSCERYNPDEDEFGKELDASGKQRYF